MKLQQALAGTVALIRVAFFACAILVVPCTKVQYYKELMQEVFAFRKPKKMNQVSPLKSPSVFKRRDMGEQKIGTICNLNEISGISGIPLKKPNLDETDRQSILGEGRVKSRTAS